MFDREFLKCLRLAELDMLVGTLPPKARVLEIGAGTGIQAKALTERGFAVVAVDLATSAYATDRVFDVIDYDGVRLPLEDSFVDAVFSSNVLEHVENLPALLADCRRVTVSGGIGVHAMPTPAWRLWTLLAGPPTAVQAALRGKLKTAAAALLPLGHGTSLEAFSELWSFSEHAWRRRFAGNGFQVVASRPVGLFHSGHMMLGPRLSIASRQRLANRLGSAARVYCVKAVN